MATIDLDSPIASSNIDFDIPKPGAPLEPEVHPKNQALVDAEIARRVEMSRAKLSRRQKNRIEQTLARCQRQLRRANYNQLLQRLVSAPERYRSLIPKYKSATTKQKRWYYKNELRKIREEIPKIRATLKKLKPVVIAYKDAARRLDAHAKVLQIEKEEKENRDAFFREATVWESQILAVFRQSPRLHHISRDKQGREVTRIPRIDHILLKPDKCYFRIRTVQQGLIDRLTNQWKSALPYGVDVKALTSDETLENLTAACGRVVTVERSPRSQNIFYVISRLDSADGIPRLVRLEQVVDHYPRKRHLETVWAAGMGEDRKITHFDFEQYPNCLVAGAAGGGKSNLINALLCQLITMNSPEEVRLFLIDNKGGVELSHFADIPHLLSEPIIRTDDVLPALKLLRTIIDQRYALFLKTKSKKLVDYNRAVKTPIPRLIVVIDELATLLGLEITDQIHSELRTISSLGRAAGVHLVVSTQHPSVDVLPGWIKTNLTLRIASRMPNHTASQIVVDSITAAHLPEVPGRMVFRRGGFEVILQAPFVDDAAIESAVLVAKQYPIPAWQIEPTPEPTPEDTAEPEPEFKFGYDEYIAAAIALDGSLSYRKIYDNGAKEFISLTEAKRLGESVIKQLTKNHPIQIHGIWYRLESLKRGYRLTDDCPENAEILKLRNLENKEIESDDKLHDIHTAVNEVISGAGGAGDSGDDHTGD